MSSALLGSAAGRLAAASASRPPDVSVRAILLNYAGGVLAPLLGLAALLTGWTITAAGGWPAAALGSLSADGLVLWSPVTTVLAVCLVLSHQPLPIAARRRPRAASVQGDCRSPATRSDDRGA